MSKLNKNFILKINEFLQNEETKEWLGENFTAVEAIVKAAIAINDVSVLGEIIGVLLPGLDLDTYLLVKGLVNNSMTMQICLSNSIESE